MSRVTLNDELIADYRRRFTDCIVAADRIPEIDEIVAGIVADRVRYEAVAQALDMPWFVVAVFHHLTTDRSFECHLHNSDPLMERTIHLPDGRPAEGEPPFTWEESAIDALKLQFLDQWQDWSLPGILFKLEGHDTWAYRLHRPEVNSPYLWCGSKHYDRGRFIAEDTWSDTAVANRCGGAVLLRRMAERGLIAFADDADENLPDALRLIRYSERPCQHPLTVELQRFLNRMPGIFVRVDGWPGPLTSAALFRVVGCYLPDDPRLR